MNRLRLYFLLLITLTLIINFGLWSCSSQTDQTKTASTFSISNTDIVADTCLKQKSDSIKAQMLEYENLLVYYHILLWDNDFESRIDPAANFKRQFKSILKDASTFNYSFDSLSQRINIKKSKDGLIKTYSWDEYSGGTWHDMACYIQFKYDKDSIGLMQYDSDEEHRFSAFTDVIVYEINEIIIDNQTHYILFGWGTHGAGHKHCTVKIAKFQKNELVFCDSILGNSKELIVEAARTENLGLDFDSITNNIIHNEFWNDHGFMRETGKTVTWELKNGKYIKIIE